MDPKELMQALLSRLGRRETPTPIVFEGDGALFGKADIGAFGETGHDEITESGLRKPDTDGPTLLYIAGLGRSGSTILDIVLGNHADIVSVGELRNLPSVGWGQNASCSCGVPMSACAFWTAVRRRWEEVVGRDGAQELVHLQARFERIRSLPRLGARRLWRRKEFRRYATLLKHLYRSISEVSGSVLIVDSSKYPLRAASLFTIPSVDLRVIHLVRDGRAVLWSIHRKANRDFDPTGSETTRRSGPLRSTISWLTVNLFCSLLLWRIGPRKGLRVRYEDFVTQPQEVLKKIGALVGRDLSGLGSALAANSPMTVGHLVAGNRIRMHEVVRLQPDFEWRDRLPQRDRHTFELFAGWLARAYGYGRG